MAKAKGLSMVSRGLRYKLKISFYLMSILPLLVCVYLVSNYILPSIGLKIDIALSVVISIFIAVIGFFVIKEVFDHILVLSKDAKLIAAGDITHRIESTTEDEVGDLGSALNQLTQRIRSNMDELKSYGERTTQINLEIQKRVLVLSSLLQISSLISQGVKLEDILKVALEKSRLLANSEAAYLLFREEGTETFFMKAADCPKASELLGVEVGEQEIFDKIIKTQRPFVLDKENIMPQNITSRFYSKFKLKNSIAHSVYLKGRVAGILGIGNNQEGFLYADEDLELLDIFAKQISIAIENDLLMHRVEKLEIRDALTGLYNQLFIDNRLQEEIKRAIAYQRPCGFILLNIDNFAGLLQSFGSLQAERVLKKAAGLISESISEIDRAGRFGDHEFAVVLPEKNKRQVQEIAEAMRKKIAFGFSEEQDERKRVILSVGISENPIDGIEAKELILKAREQIKGA